MNASHTPGPWIQAPSGEVMHSYSQPFGIVQVGEENLVAGIFGDVRGGEGVALANARLIAAAPDMLERLQLTEKFLQTHLRGESLPATWEEMMGDIDVVIAMAKGEF